MSGFEPRTMKVTLYQGDWQQRVDEARNAAFVAENALAEARKKAEKPGGPRLLTDDSPEAAVAAAQAEYDRLAAVADDLKDQAEAEGSVVVTLKALGRKRWNELVMANPPRTDESIPEAIRKNDAEFGVNDDAMGDAVVPESIVHIEGVDMVPAAFADVVSSAQFALLYGAAFALNRGTGFDPKGASRMTPSRSSSVTES